MPPSDYALGSYSGRAPAVAVVARLNDLCFGQYPGVVTGGESFMRWYMRRPGLDYRLSQAAWCGDDLVGGLFVTLMGLHLSGSLRGVGIIDTVMTHPEHRRRGLARALLSATISRARELGLAYLQLYTAPGSAGHNLYTSLGFRDRATLRYWTRETAATDAGSPWRPCPPADRGHIPEVIRAARAHYDGVPDMSREYWAWRRTDRPPELAAETWVRPRPGHPLEAVALLPTPMTDLGLRTVCSDLIVRQEDSLESLCASLPVGTSLVALADEADALLTGALRLAGFAPGSTEVAMLLPLLPTPPADRSALPWFPFTESVIGV